MSKKCELTGKIPLKGHNVSHANNKTKRRFLPNLKKVRFKSESLNKSLKLTVSNAGMRTVDKKGSEKKIKVTGRHDPCVGVRATPIAEAMTALVIIDHYLRNRAQNADVISEVPDF